MCERPNVPRSDAKDLGELEKPLRDRIWTAMQHSPRKSAGGPSGLALVSGYRDPGSQWDLRHERVPHGQECNPRVKAYPATAVPYASDHGRRKAADIGGVDLLWLYRNCRAFGLWHNVSTENWHYVVSGTPTVRIIEYPGVAYDNAGPIRPAPPIPTPPKETFLMALTDQQQADLYKRIVRIDQNAEAAVTEGRTHKNEILGRMNEIRQWVKLVVEIVEGVAAKVFDRVARSPKVLAKLAEKVDK